MANRLIHACLITDRVTIVPGEIDRRHPDPGTLKRRRANSSRFATPT